jgi:hypothetical protein
MGRNALGTVVEDDFDGPMIADGAGQRTRAQTPLPVGYRTLWHPYGVSYRGGAV